MKWLNVTFTIGWLLAMVLVGTGSTMVVLLTNTSSSIGKVEHKVLKRIISLKNFARQERWPLSPHLWPLRPSIYVGPALNLIQSYKWLTSRYWRRIWRSVLKSKLSVLEKAPRPFVGRPRPPVLVGRKRGPRRYPHAFHSSTSCCSTIPVIS